MSPDFWWFVTELRRLGRKPIVRCNLTIIVANKKYHDPPEFFKQHVVEVVSSLSFYSADKTDRQRGAGVFADSGGRCTCSTPWATAFVYRACSAIGSLAPALRWAPAYPRPYFP